MIKFLRNAILAAIIICGLGRQAEAQEKKTYTSLAEVWNDVRQYNLTFKSAQIQTELIWLIKLLSEMSSILVCP